MTEDPAFLWDRPTQPPPRPQRSNPQRHDRRPGTPEPPDPPQQPRGITLRDAAARYGVSVGTLRSWAKNGRIDASKDERGRWLADPASVAAESARTAGTPPVTRAPGPAPTSTGPTDDGTAMLVPRDAWDRLIDQLGNLHEAGLMLAEARERAVKAETEASFLRERLAEMRSERDDLRRTTSRAPAATEPPQAVDQPPTGSVSDRARSWAKRLFG